MTEYADILEAIRELSSYLHYYNRDRRHSSLGYLTPADFDLQSAVPIQGLALSVQTEAPQGFTDARILRPESLHENPEVGATPAALLGIVFPGDSWFVTWFAKSLDCDQTIVIARRYGASDSIPLNWTTGIKCRKKRSRRGSE